MKQQIQTHLGVPSLCVLLPEIQTQPCPALYWYWHWPPRPCVHTTPELVWDRDPQELHPAQWSKQTAWGQCVWLEEVTTKRHIFKFPNLVKTLNRIIKNANVCTFPSTDVWLLGDLRHQDKQLVVLFLPSAAISLLKKPAQQEDVIQRAPVKP